MIKLNTDQAARDAIMAPFMRDQKSFGDIRYFEKLTHEALAKLVELKFADPDETQNNSPSIEEFLEFMSNNPHCTAHGYVVDLPRTDYRVSIEGLSYWPKRNDIDAVRDFAHFCNGADELDLHAMRSWWD